MPKKKLDEPEVEETTIPDVEASVLETSKVDASLPEVPKVVKEIKLTVCGHVDMHSFGPDGKHDQPSCTLSPGHPGDHYAKHKQKVERERFYERESGKLLKIEYDTLDVDAWWNDAAGKPVEEIKVGKMPSRSRKTELSTEIEHIARE